MTCRRIRYVLIIALMCWFSNSAQSLSVSVRSSTSKATTTMTADAIQSACGVYVHIPYCRRRCRYCDFAIVPIGTKTNIEGRDRSEPVDGNDGPDVDRATAGFLQMDASYREALLREIETAVVPDADSCTKRRIRSVYFGGGTPSLAPLETLQSSLLAIRDGFDVLPDAEITIEMDPGTFSIDKLRQLRDCGFNRISLGVQSFNDTVLEHIGRVHRSNDIHKSVAMIAEVFGEDDNGPDHHRTANYSIDLISGLPAVSLALWADTLEAAVSLTPRPSHVSVYDLQIESGTVFGKWYDQHDEQDDTTDDRFPSTTSFTSSTPVSLPSNTRPHLPGADDCAFMYKFASGYLRARGYEHYEISSYALPGRRSKHNQIYWEPTAEWYAFGLGATSSIGGKRTSRPRLMNDYIRWVQKGSTDDADTANHDDEMVGDNDSDTERWEMMTDIIMRRLRTSDGLDIDLLQDAFPEQPNIGRSVLAGATLGLQLGLAERNHYDDENEKYGTLQLKDPEGFLFSNSIISSIFMELDDDEDSEDGDDK